MECSPSEEARRWVDFGVSDANQWEDYMNKDLRSTDLEPFYIMETRLRDWVTWYIYHKNRHRGDMEVARLHVSLGMKLERMAQEGRFRNRTPEKKMAMMIHMTVPIGYVPGGRYIAHLFSLYICDADTNFRGKWIPVRISSPGPGTLYWHCRDVVIHLRRLSPLITRFHRGDCHGSVI